MKPFSADGQAVTFLTMAYAGFGAAILCDLASPLRRRRAVTPAVDLLVMLIAAAAIAAAYALGGESALRAYGLLGVVWGALAYCAGIRRLARRAVKFLRARHQNRQETRRARRKE